METEPFVKHKKSDKHWYYFVYRECVLCGASESYKYRRYDERPDDWWERHSYEQFVCWGHFL